MRHTDWGQRYREEMRTIAGGLSSGNGISDDASVVRAASTNLGSSIGTLAASIGAVTGMQGEGPAAALTGCGNYTLAAFANTVSGNALGAVMTSLGSAADTTNVQVAAIPEAPTSLQSLSKNPDLLPQELAALRRAMKGSYTQPFDAALGGVAEHAPIGNVLKNPGFYTAATTPAPGGVPGSTTTDDPARTTGGDSTARKPTATANPTTNTAAPTKATDKDKATPVAQKQSTAATNPQAGNRGSPSSQAPAQQNSAAPVKGQQTSPRQKATSDTTKANATTTPSSRNPNAATPTSLLPGSNSTRPGTNPGSAAPGASRATPTAAVKTPGVFGQRSAAFSALRGDSSGRSAATTPVSGASPSRGGVSPMGVPHGAVAPGAGGSEHRTPGYLIRRQNGEQIIGKLPLVGPRVIGEREDDNVARDSAAEANQLGSQQHSPTRPNDPQRRR